MRMIRLPASGISSSRTKVSGCPSLLKMQSSPCHAFSSRTAAFGSFMEHVALSVRTFASCMEYSPRSAMLSCKVTAGQNGMRPARMANTPSTAHASVNTTSMLVWSYRRRITARTPRSITSKAINACTTIIMSKTFENTSAFAVKS